MSAEDAEYFIRAGWTKLGEWIEDEHINEPNTPEGPKITYAVGSMEWRAQTEKDLADRKAAAEEQKKRRLARLAAFRGGNCKRWVSVRCDNVGHLAAAEPACSPRGGGAIP